jgi:nucleoside-diphosphate-sugar epimerase
MKNVIITGATGMIGSLVLQYALESPEVAKVTSIVRKPSGIKHAKLEEVVHGNFLDFSAIKDKYANQEIAYFCIGVYTGAVPRDKFREITVGYTEAFAKTLREQSNSTTFCFLSGDGADRTEKSKLMFARDKGIAENIIDRLHFNRFYSFRPGYIYPVTPRVEPNFAYRAMRALYKPLHKVFPAMGITSEEVAKAMFKGGLYGAGKDILSSRDIRELASE